MTAALNQLARISAESMLNCMLEGIAIGFFAWILLRVGGRRNSSTRFAVWFSALVAIAALPVLSVAAPSARAGNAGSAITVPGSWALDIFFIWAAIAGVALLRVGVGLWQLRKLRASCDPVDAAALDPALRATLRDFQTVRSVTLCQSDRLQVPTAIGFLKPVVVIPVWALQELSAQELNSILIHELTHLRRRDDWTNLAQQILKALFFFHPAVWWIESKLALEREMACDDAVLATTANPRGYARCLLSVAERSFTRRGLALAQAAVNKVRQTSLRVSQILDVNRSSATRVWKPAVYSVAAFVGICLLSVSRAPELVAFEDRMPDVVASGNSATATLASASEFNSFAKQAVVTPASFHVRSPEADRPAQPAAAAFARTQQIAEGRSSQPLSGSFQAPEIRQGTTSPRPRISVEAGLTNTDADESSARVLDTQFVQPESQTSARVRSNEQIDGQPQAPQAILVVMQSTQYIEAGPMLWRVSVWRVTVLDSSRVAVETRIPTKQI